MRFPGSGLARPGLAWQGKVRFLRYGRVRWGKVRSGMVGSGEVRLGQVRLLRHGMGWRGRAGCGEFLKKQKGAF